MPLIACTLLTDGTSDRVLMPLLQCLLDKYCTVDYRISFATDGIPTGFRNLRDRIRYAIEQYPCDILFMHRDAEREDPASRFGEISEAIQNEGCVLDVIPIVPVRMTEAWLLPYEVEIRRAAGNQAGRMPLNLPAAGRVEGVADPKALLFEALRVASGLGGQRLQRFDVHRARHRVGELIEDTGCLAPIGSFSILESTIREYFLEKVQN